MHTSGAQGEGGGSLVSGATSKKLPSFISALNLLPCILPVLLPASTSPLQAYDSGLETADSLLKRVLATYYRAITTIKVDFTGGLRDGTMG